MPHVQEAINVNNSFCSTAIIIVTPFNSSSTGMNIEVEVFNDSGSTQKLESWGTAYAGARWTVVTDSQIQVPFYWLDKDLNLDNFSGFATVNSDDPRLYVTAYDWC